MATSEYFSLLIGFVVLLLVVVFTSLFTITRGVGLWITWCYNVSYLRSLPSPPAGHWLWGHALEVTI